MKIKELIKELKKYDQDANVYLSADSEGNYFGTLDKELSFGIGPNNFLMVFPIKEGLEFEELE